jgi:hypothetical protein
MNDPGRYMRGIRSAEVLTELFRKVHRPVLAPRAPEAHVHESELPIQEIIYSHVHEGEGVISKLEHFFASREVGSDISIKPCFYFELFLSPRIRKGATVENKSSTVPSIF